MNVIDYTLDHVLKTREERGLERARYNVWLDDGRQGTMIGEEYTAKDGLNVISWITDTFDEEPACAPWGD